MTDIREARPPADPVRAVDYLPGVSAIVALVALLAAIALFAPRHPPVAPPLARKPYPPRQRQLPGTDLPPAPVVEPTIVRDLSPDQARASNAALPSTSGDIAPARPFIFTGSPADRANALTCLAAAEYYEAGDDKEGEQAVAQVVLNRARHPAFPKTVCGVVFQGADRPTGCQFTFTCDGSLRRIPDPHAWERARAVAQSALTGFVFKPIGTATHYHADWVVPYWRDSLVKLTTVHTHIFYRWAGGWGLPPAFTGHLQPLEPIDRRIVALAGPEAASDPAMPEDDATAAGALPIPRAALTVPGVPSASLHGSIVRLMDEDASQYILLLNSRAPESGYAAVARAICRQKANCLVMGWLTEQWLPRQLPVMPAGMQSMAFLFRKSSVLGMEKAYWNCRQIHHPALPDCIPGTEP